MWAAVLAVGCSGFASLVANAQQVTGEGFLCTIRLPANADEASNPANFSAETSASGTRDPTDPSQVAYTQKTCRSDTDPTFVSLRCRAPIPANTTTAQDGTYRDVPCDINRLACGAADFQRATQSTLRIVDNGTVAILSCLFVGSPPPP